MYIPDGIERILLSEDEIRAKVAEMGAVLTAEYDGANPLFVCVLKGASVFFADLIRQVECPLEIAFLRAESYGGGEQSCGSVRLTAGADIDIEGRDVVVVEDILDTARTLYSLKNELLKRNPKSLKIVTLLDKPSRRAIKGFSADYCGFAVEDLFVVGYGLDFDEKYRNLRYIGIKKKD